MKHPDIQYHNASRELFEEADRLIAYHSDSLEMYLDRLFWWNHRINLVSRSVPRETIREHIRHSLLSAGLESFREADTILDAGTGGGLPGLPLAVCHPDKSFILNDIVTKKILAVRQMARHLDLQNVRAVDGSLEYLTRKEPCLILSKHSFKLPEILGLSNGLPWGEMVLYKGAELDGELETADMERLSGVDVLKLENGEPPDFYRGKALVRIRRSS